MSNVSDLNTSFGSAQQPLLGDFRRLIEFAADVTETLRLDDGVYCFDRDARDFVKRNSAFTWLTLKELWRTR